MAHAYAVEAEPLPACLYSIPVTPYYQYLNDAANGFPADLAGCQRVAHNICATLRLSWCEVLLASLETYS